MFTKTYWKQLLRLTRKLCKYIDRWGDDLPTDLPAAVTVMFPYVRAACAALKEYDRTRAGGDIYPEE